MTEELAEDKFVNEEYEQIKSLSYPKLPNGMKDFRISSLYTIAKLANFRIKEHPEHTYGYSDITIYCKALENDPNPFCKQEITKKFTAYYDERIYYCKSCLGRINYIQSKTRLSNSIWPYGYTLGSLHLLSQMENVHIYFEDFTNLTITLKNYVRFDCKTCSKITQTRFMSLAKRRYFYCIECKPAIPKTIHDYELLCKIGEENQLEFRYDYKNEPLWCNYSIEFKCKRCGEWMSKLFSAIRLYKVYCCAPCHQFNVNGSIRHDKKLIEQILKEENVQSITPIKDEINRNDIISLKCKTENCIRITTKTVREWVKFKTFYCNVCSFGRKLQKDEIVCCTHKEYENFIKIFNTSIITKNINLTCNQIIVGKCIMKECKEYYFIPMSKLYTERLPYCDECSSLINYNRLLKSKYDRKVVEKIFKNYEIDNYLFLPKGEVTKNTFTSFNCKTNKCNQLCNIKVDVLVETENVYCRECNVKNLEVVIYDKKLFDDVMPILYKGINLEIVDLDEELNENTILKYKCQFEECSEHICRKFHEMIDMPEIYCQDHLNDSNYFDRQVRILVNVRNIRIDGKYNNLGYHDSITGWCKTPGCNEKFTKTALAIVNNKLPNCSECSMTIQLTRTSRSTGTQKEYILPSGDVTLIQGYEDGALDILFEQGYKEDEILNLRKDIPKINYNYKNKNRRYLVDIYIPKENRFIEVKSIRTYMMQLDKNWAKHDGTIKSGYTHEFWILDQKRNLLDIIKERPDIENYTSELISEYEEIIKVQNQIENDDDIDTETKTRRLKLRKKKNNNIVIRDENEESENEL